jgi:hypothetical protein
MFTPKYIEASITARVKGPITPNKASTMMSAITVLMIMAIG